MKHPDIFSSVYGHCSCCLTISPGYFDEKTIHEAMSIDNWDAMLKGSFFAKAVHTFSAAYSPNPANPPFYSDLPYELAGDSLVISENVKAKWSANIPSWMADQYVSNLQQLRGIALDGGGHTDKLTERFYNNILPYFSEILVSEE